MRTGAMRGLFFNDQGCLQYHTGIFHYLYQRISVSAFLLCGSLHFRMFPCFSLQSIGTTDNLAA